jgi:hypothetical protein
LGSAWQLQCVGCDRNFLWYSVGLPLVSLVRVGFRWSCWYSLKLNKTVECSLVCLRRCVVRKASSELTLPTLAGLKTFSMRGTLRPDGWGSSYKGVVRTARWELAVG